MWDFYCNAFFGYRKYFINAQNTQSPFAQGLTIVPILLLANIFLGLYYNAAVWYKTQNKTIYGAIFAIVAAIITIVCNYIFILNIVMWLVRGLLCVLICNVFNELYCWQKHIKVPYNLFKIFAYIIGAVVFYMFFYYLKSFQMSAVCEYCYRDYFD